MSYHLTHFYHPSTVSRPISGNASDYSAIGAGPSVVRGNKQSVAMLYSTWLLGRAPGGKGQQAVSVNALDDLAIGEGPSVVRDSKQSAAMP